VTGFRFLPASFLNKLQQKNCSFLSYFPSHFTLSIFISVWSSWMVYKVTSML
jgi:hypothetical protein